MTIQFWTNDPTVLFNKEYIFELWPTTEMCYEQKLNAITRLIILITILGYVSTMSQRILVIGFLTLAVIFVLFKMRKQKLTSAMIQEGFGDNISPSVLKQKPKSITNPVTLETVLNDEFKEGNKRNPFSNVLLTQINDDPERKSAPPSFNVDVDEDITKNIKKTVQMLNPGIKNTNKQLYPDLWQNFLLDDSNRVFYSTANTRIEPGDQGAFAQFLYNDLKYSGKESTAEGAITRVKDSYRYTLY
jgi:hypothetical protein